MAAQTHFLRTLFTSLPPTLKSRSNPILSKRTTLIVTCVSFSGRKIRAAVIGGGPAGSSTAEALSSGDIETFLFDRSPDAAKPYSGAIPLCMLDEFNIPMDLIDWKVTQMKFISPFNLTVDFGKTLKPNQFISMLRREMLDLFLRLRAKSSGTMLVTALVTSLEVPTSKDVPYVVHYTKGK